MEKVKKSKQVTIGPIHWNEIKPGLSIAMCEGANPADRKASDYNISSMFVWLSQAQAAQQNRKDVHVHMAEETIIVLEGTLYLGKGDVYRPEEAICYGPGSVVKIAYHEPHFQWHGEGDFVCLYIYYGYPELTYSEKKENSRQIGQNFEKVAGARENVKDKTYLTVDFSFDMECRMMGEGCPAGYQLFGGNLPNGKEDTKYKINTFALWYGKETLKQVEPSWVHVHLGEEQSLILDGKIHVVFGDVYDPKKDAVTPPGSVFSIAAGKPHWEWFDTDSEMLAIINSFQNIGEQYTCGIIYQGSSELISERSE